MEQNSPPEVNEFLTRQAQDWHADAKTPSSVTEAVRFAVFTEEKKWGLHRISRWQMAAAACVFLVGVPFAVVRLLPNPTLAAITRAMFEVRTAQWRTETEQRDSKTGALVRTWREHILIDRERNAGRFERESNYVSVSNPEGTFSVHGKKFIPVEITNTTTPLREVLQRRIFNGKEVFGRKEDWRIGEEVVQGSRLIHLSRSVAETTPAEAAIPAGTTRAGGREIWADPETFRIVRMRHWLKYAERDPPHRVLDITYTAHSYEYDKPIPESAFFPKR